MSDTPTMPTISKAIAKNYAVRIYEQVQAFTDAHEDEYIGFLKSRQSFSENARKELERLGVEVTP